MKKLLQSNLKHLISLIERINWNNWKKIILNKNSLGPLSLCHYKKKPIPLIRYLYYITDHLDMFTTYYMQVKILMSDLNKQCGRQSLAPTHAIPLQITRSAAFKIFHSGHAADLNVHWRCLISGIVQILPEVIIKTNYNFWLKILEPLQYITGCLIQ